MSAAGSIAAAQAQADAARYQAQINEMNAKIARKRARDALERGKLEEQQKRQDVQAVLGRQRAAMAANGVDINFGSPLDTLADAAMMGEMDSLIVRTNFHRQAYNHDVEAENFRAQANLNRMEAKAATTGGFLSAMGTIIGGFGKVYEHANS